MSGSATCWRSQSRLLLVVNMHSLRTCWLNRFLERLQPSAAGDQPVARDAFEVAVGKSGKDVGEVRLGGHSAGSMPNIGRSCLARWTFPGVGWSHSDRVNRPDPEAVSGECSVSLGHDRITGRTPWRVDDYCGHRAVPRWAGGGSLRSRAPRTHLAAVPRDMTPNMRVVGSRRFAHVGTVVTRALGHEPLPTVRSNVIYRPVLRRISLGSAHAPGSHRRWRRSSGRCRSFGRPPSASRRACADCRRAGDA